MSKQLNIRLPESTAKQLQALIEHTKMTQVQLIIVAIDRFFQSEIKKDNNMGYTEVGDPYLKGLTGKVTAIIENLIKQEGITTPDAFKANVDSLQSKLLNDLQKEAKKEYTNFEKYGKV